MTEETPIGSVETNRGKVFEISVARSSYRLPQVYLRLVRLDRDRQRAPSSMCWMAIDGAAGDKMLELLTAAFKEANRPLKNAEAHEDIC